MQLYQFALVILASVASSVAVTEVRTWLIMWRMRRDMRRNAGHVLARLEARALEREHFWDRMAQRAKEDAAVDTNAKHDIDGYNRWVDAYNREVDEHSVNATPVWPADAVLRMRQALDPVTPMPTPKEES